MLLKSPFVIEACFIPQEVQGVPPSRLPTPGKLCTPKILTQNNRKISNRSNDYIDLCFTRFAPPPLPKKIPGSKPGGLTSILIGRHKLN